MQIGTGCVPVGGTSGWNMCTRLCNSFSDQTNAIPHWLWNQPSAPPVHPEDGVKGCLGNAMKVSEPQKLSSCHSQINLARLQPLKAKSIMLNSSRSWNHGLMIFIISPENNHANRYRLCTSGWNMCTRLCNSFSDQTNAIPHWLWNQPSAPPVHPEDGVKGCLGNAMKVSEPQKMSSCHPQINLARLYPLKAKSLKNK